MRVDKTKVSIIMARKGLSQQDLADKASMSRGNLSGIINGKSCKASTIINVSNALEVDVTEIIED